MFFAVTRTNDITINSLRQSDAYMRRQSNHHWFRWWLVAWSAPSHYLNQCWNIVHWTLRNKLQWNVNRNSYIFIKKNPFENVDWKTAAILSRPQCVKPVIKSTETNSLKYKSKYFNFLPTKCIKNAVCEMLPFFVVSLSLNCRSGKQHNAVALLTVQIHITMAQNHKQSKFINQYLFWQS